MQIFKTCVLSRCIESRVRVEEMRNSAFRMAYILWSETQQQIVATAEAVMVCVDKSTGLKCEIPNEVKVKLLN